MSDNDLIRRGDAMGAVSLSDTVARMSKRIADIPSQDARIRGEVIEAAAALCNFEAWYAIDALHTPESRAAVKGGA